MKISLSSLMVLILLTVPGPISAQKPIDPLLERLEKHLDEKHIPGAMISIVTADSILFAGGVGYANLETKESVNEEHLFRVGSISKSFTALGLYKLAQQDQIQLDQPIRSIDSTIPYHNKWADSPVTVEHLLEHTSGFDNFHLHAMYNTIDKKRPPTRMMVKAHRKSLTSRWQPGTRKAYSNVGYVVAGHLIEKVSRKPYDLYIKDEILTPLGMNNSGYYFKMPEYGNFAQGYNYKGGRHVPVPFYSIQGGPAGDFCTNAKEMATYLQFMLRREGRLIDSSLFNREDFDRIENAKSSLAAGAGLPGGYGLGNYSIWKNGYRFYGHSGGIDGFSSRYMYSREANLGVVVSINREGNANALVDEILEYYFPSESVVLERNIETIPDSLKAKYQGYYCFRSPDQELTGFTDRMLAGLKLEFKTDSVIVKGVLGKYKSTLFYAGNKQFYRDQEGIPSVALLNGDHGKPALWFNENYTEKEFWVKRLIQNFTIWISFLLPFIFFVSSSIWMLKQKVSKSKKPINHQLILWSACLSYLLMFLAFALAMENRLTAGQVNFNSILLFISSLALIVFSVWSFVKCFTIKAKGFSKAYYIVNALAVVVLSLFFLYNGFIGLRLWAY